MPTVDEIRAQITGPGGPFELVDAEVLGAPVKVFKNRPAHLREMLAGAAAHGDKEHIVFGERRITFAELIPLVASTARALEERYGVGPGDRVAILAANCPEWVITWWATVSLGGIVSALNGWWTHDEIRYGLEHSEPKLLVADRKRLARIPRDEIEAEVLEIESEFESLTSHAPDAPLPETPIAEDDPAVILYTSGTTGRPKGAVGSHRGIVGFVQQQMANGIIGMLSSASKPDAAAMEMSALVTAPLFHMSGLYAMAVMLLATGGKTIYRGGRFDPDDVLSIIEKERVTFWSALGSTGPRVVDSPNFGNFDVSSMRRVGFGGAPTSPALQERIRKAFPNAAANIGLGYGSSEAVAVVATIGGDELAKHPTSVGPPAVGMELEIRGEDGKPLPEGEEGEIHVRSAWSMLEYWRDEANTAKAILSGRWLAMGDIGTVKDGLLYINSRARDLILRAAENVSPVEIENRLDAHAEVLESAVIGVDHPELGQEVKAVVVPAGGASLDPEVLRAWCAETLSAYKVPSLWEIRSEPLPRNAAGKVLKTALTGSTTPKLLEE
jgi:acyl-CoA synthetase (AMP-forming)/AMP-acid ligase II